jgi:hypothetical protein
MQFVFEKVIEKLCRFFWVGSCGVLQGIFRETGVFMWCFDGENVVSCAVDVVF